MMSMKGTMFKGSFFGISIMVASPRGYSAAAAGRHFAESTLMRRWSAL